MTPAAAGKEIPWITGFFGVEGVLNAEFIFEVTSRIGVSALPAANCSAIGRGATFCPPHRLPKNLAVAEHELHDEAWFGAAIGIADLVAARFASDSSAYHRTMAKAFGAVRVRRQGGRHSPAIAI